MEILLPAGSEECLAAAVRCGADSVYLGGSRLNARRGAANFDEGQLASAVSFCHARGVKVYLTINILILEKELSDLRKALEHACRCGVDAILVQDLAVAAAARKACPGLPLHASTQMSVHNPAGVRFLESLGFSRVVLARELAISEIREIRKNSSIELEAFIHGALCMSVSGQCYLSAMIGGRSGNRGLCAQPCRLPFAFGKEENALSLKDLSIISRMKELEEAGISCVKVEGRMKRPEYVAAAATACVAARNGKSPDMEALAAVFSRGGFTEGYLTGKRDSSMFGVRRKEDVTAATNAILKKQAALYRKEAQRVPVNFFLSIKKDRPSSLKVSDNVGNIINIPGEIPEEALTAPTDGARAKTALSKTGDTPFYPGNISCDISPGLMLPASAINDLRRRALTELLAKREALVPIAYSDGAAIAAHAVDGAGLSPDKLALRVKLSRAEQLPAAIESRAELIFLPLGCFDKNTPRDKRIAVSVPRFGFGGEAKLKEKLLKLRESGVADALAGSPGGLILSLEAGFATHGDAFLNITNSVALEEYRRIGLKDAIISFEPELASSRGLSGTLPRGIVAYGYLPLMAMRNCPVKAHSGKCKGSGCGNRALTDRLGKKFFAACENNTAMLYNCVPLWMCDKKEQLKDFGFATLYFTKESPEETAGVISAWENGSPPPGEHTRGLYYRGVE